MLIARIIENNTMYTTKKCIYVHFYFHFYLHFHYQFLPHQYFQYILQLIFFHSYNLKNLNIHQYHKIYRTRIYNYQDSKQIHYRIHLYKLVLCIHTYIYLHSNIVYFLFIYYLFTFPGLVILSVLYAEKLHYCRNITS